MEVAIEAKSVAMVTSDHLKYIRELKKDFPNVKSRIVVCLEKHIRKTDDGILILPYQNFIEKLWHDELV